MKPGRWWRSTRNPRAWNFVNTSAPEDRVIGNPDRLVQVFVNLLRNALNAVEIRRRDGSRCVRGRRASAASRESLLTVEDNGPGIPADVLPDIFDAFVTTRLDARGTGLGLTVARGNRHAARRDDRGQQSPRGRGVPGSVAARADPVATAERDSPEAIAPSSSTSKDGSGVATRKIW